MKKQRIIITLIVAALAAVPLAYASPGEHGPRGMRERGPLAMFGHLDRIREELDLSDAQVSQIREIVKSTREQNKEYRQQMHGTMKDVATTLLTNPNDVAGAQSILDRKAASEKALKANVLAATSKALNVLTAEQRTKLALHLAERGERRENRRR